MIVKIFHEYLSQSRTNDIKEDLQKLEDKINTFAVQKGVVIHDIKYEKIQNNQMQNMTIAFVHHTAISEDTGEVKQDDIPRVMVEKK
jgi:uncharacterized Fe-S cluster-containing protein